jgi:acetyl esterase/lipase
MLKGMTMRLRLGLIAVMAVFGFASAAAAADPVVIPLYAGPAPGSERATQPEVTMPGKTGRILRNITAPTLTVYAPAAGTGNGVGVIIAPGGGYFILSIDNEGTALAQRLADRGVTVFVLKYRLQQTPADNASAMAQLMKALGSIKTGADGLPPLTDGETWAAADAERAMRLVRERAKSFGVDPHKVGFVGFSAGAMLSLRVATSPDAEVRPDFVAPIYGALRSGLTVQAGDPPAFIAAASDDPLLPGASLPIYQAWRAKGLTAELHIYDKGGHGFGVTPQGTTSDQWLADFDAWMRAHHWMSKGS